METNKMVETAINWSRRLAWIRDNTLKPIVPNSPGLYEFYDVRGRKIYIGHSSILRHRIQSYMQKDCYTEHPTKRPLRSIIGSFRYAVMPLDKARKIEKQLKMRTTYNFW